MASGGTATEVEVDGRRIALSNLDKVLFPGSGLTKAGVIDYYVRVSAAMLPHVERRPLTLKRYPDGTDGKSFYAKNCPSHRPGWVRTVTLPSGRTQGKTVEYCSCDDLPTLVWLANLAAIELHPLLARDDDPASPTAVVFDLDPGPPAGVIDCARVACWLKEVFDALDLEVLPKTSGSKGLQLYLPLNVAHGYDRTKHFAHSVAELMERAHPGSVVRRMDKSLRRGKVLIDWSQNHPTKTTVAAYSLRAAPTPRVSTPVGWDEVGAALAAADPGLLEFEADQVLERVERIGDLFAPVAELRQELPATLPH